MTERARTMCWIAVACALGAGPSARAEGPPEPAITGYVAAGSYYSSDDDYYSSEYTGFGENEWNVLGDFEVRGRPAWDSGDVWHFHLRGQNLGLDSRRIDGEGGLQGLFRIHASWDQIPHLLFDDADIVFHGRGNDLLTLPTGWVPATTTRGFAALPQTLDPIRFSRERRDLRFGTDTVLPHGFELSTHYKYDRQTGRKPIGSVIGNSGGNPRAVIVPEGIDWRTHDGDIALRYASEALQGELGYEISRFSDEQDTLTWQNPFSAIGGWNPAAGYPTGFGGRGLPPDNEFHQVKASGGYELPYDTRIMAHAAFGWMLQDDSFEPYTVNPALVVTTPPEKNDADAKIHTRDVGVRITSRPIEHLRATAEWRLDDRDNDTPRRTFIYVPGDSLDQSTIDSDRARVNLPQSYRRNDGRIDLGYEIFERTEVTAGYQHLVTERSWTEADEVKENVVRAGFRTRPIEQVDFRVDGTWADRDGGDYFYNAPLVWGFSPEHVATTNPATDFENNPLLRKFTLADRERQSIDAHLSVMPIESLTLGAGITGANEDYDNSELGLRSRRALSWTIDASWSPLETLTAYAYYTRDSFQSRQSGRSFNSDPVQAFDPNRNWRQDDEDDVDTVGAGAEWIAIADRLTLRADFVYSFAKDSIDFATGPALPPSVALPTSDSRLYDVSIQAELRLVEHVKARVGYLFESFEADDWALDGVEPNTINEVLTLGQENPNYQSHIVGFSIEYDF
jgi:MtrB/PioB family decaheme-associated outer membrane protein